MQLSFFIFEINKILEKLQTNNDYNSAHFQSNFRSNQNYML